MNKRGQIYVLAVLILALALYLLLTKENIVHTIDAEDDFEQLAKNYEIESTKLLNTAIEQQIANPNELIANFSILFSSYAKTKNPTFALTYFFAHDDMLYIGNFMEQPIYYFTPLIPPGAVLLDGCANQITSSLSVAGLQVMIPGLELTQFDICLEAMSLAGVAPATIDISFMLDDVSYNATYNRNNPEMAFIATQQHEQQRKVYAKGFK